jgi:outer membrane protein TolC
VSALILLATSTPVAAQDPGPSLLRLTLEEALRRAEANNPGHLSAINNLELNRADTRGFWLGLLPQPQINLLSTNMQWNRQSFGTDNFGNPIANPDFRMVQTASSSQSASLSFNLSAQELFGRRTDRIQGEIREAAADQSSRALASDVRLAFLDAQERLQSQDLEATLLSMRSVNFDITEDLFRLARVDRAELLTAEIDLLDQQQQLEQSRAALGTALLALRNVIGDPSIAGIGIQPAELRVFDPASLDHEAIVRTALDSGPRIRQSQLTVRQAEGQIWLERAEWFPTLGLSASTGRQELSRESGSSFLQPVPDGEWSRRISLSLSFPDLGAYFNRQTTGMRTDVQIRNAQESLRATRFSVEEEVRGLLLDLTNQYGTLRLQERRAELAQERLALEQERYRLGDGDYLQLQNSAEGAANAQRQALQARYGFERALIQLERSLGEPIAMPEDAPG